MNWKHGAGTLGVLLGMVGCQTVVIPQVDPALARIGQAQGARASSLADGRRILTTRCISCHSLEPVDRYSRDRWREIVGEMAPRAKLDAKQEADLLAFLFAAREHAGLAASSAPR